MFRCCAGCSKYLMLLFIAAVCRHFPSTAPSVGPRHWACAGNPEVTTPSWSFAASGGNRSKQLTDGSKAGARNGELAIYAHAAWDIPVLYTTFK